MPFLSRPPETFGDQVYFNDQIFCFKDPGEARDAAKLLADCNENGSLWELVDLTARFEASGMSRMPEAIR